MPSNTMQRTRQCWSDMKQRVLNQQHPQYKNYGARGITICKEWADSFAAFLADMGEKPDGKTLDRIDNDAGYNKGNCRWATPLEQRLNQRGNIFLCFNGKRLTIEHWSRETGLHRDSIKHRLDKGWPVDAILSTNRFPGNHRAKDLAIQATRKGEAC